MTAVDGGAPSEEKILLTLLCSFPLRSHWVCDIPRLGWWGRGVALPIKAPKSIGCCGVCLTTNQPYLHFYVLEPLP